MANFELQQKTQNSLASFLAKYERVGKEPYVFAGVRLYPAEVHALEFIWQKKVSFVSELAKETNITRGAASQVTIKLFKKGLLRQTTDPKNKSRKLLKTTPKGEQVCLAHAAHHQERDADFYHFVDSVSDRELESVKLFMQKLNEWIEGYM
ncbi:MarR family winged helix-turn-helix transcriptional regulator [Dethiosulfatarculus sandiegensis]|uniref:HTH marR-type domain-containing protein n=1 Tax=Dethiosulfatarculus sandiegensis TaxID=1429043 RepID=A0A0D2JY22_9BACT|nr:MarR family winged helix-turn-helix transcriptional regulator [Dethiosulfatarculus sandiegensis]KIX14460.1 hypothetical protein X474_10240 [Dethiosulfatarculus sandiegensis]